MGTSGQTLQEQDKSFRGNLVLQKMSAVTCYITWQRASDITQLRTLNNTKATSDAAVKLPMAFTVLVPCSQQGPRNPDIPQTFFHGTAKY